MLDQLRSLYPEKSDEYRLVAQIDEKYLPKHVAIIMDGNGRWAKLNGLPRTAGHSAGAETARAITESCARLGITHLTLFTFSSENWKRPASEIRFLMNMLYEKLSSQEELLRKNKIRLKIFGDIDRLPAKLRKKLRETESGSQRHQGLQVNLALNYGARNEIIRAVRQIVAQGVSPAKINEKTFSGYLHTAGCPDPDLLIRTSGELRISNFLLYQIAYSELYFTPILWPDFKAADLFRALIDFQGRNRRFGNI
ncbi:MAG TPA: polyprenyl diphosphate synthase [Candidatus Binatia bacterium]|nr:polyprenyl diphosphate synthase [Candidatus Binatia bacterium]